MHGGEHFDRLVRIDDLVRLGIERNSADVGGEDFAVAVDDIGARGHQVVGRADRGDAFRRGHAILHEAPADDRIDHAEAADDDGDAAAGLRARALARALRRRGRHCRRSGCCCCRRR
jgi:hypothetical protein